MGEGKFTPPHVRNQSEKTINEFYGPATDRCGIQKRRNILTFLMYLLLSLGIFSHEAVSMSSLGFHQVRWSTLGASFVVGLALLPPVIRWINLKTEGRTNSALC
jgi:hypothetical protein